MSKLIVGGCDPSLSNFGMCKATYSEGLFTPTDLFLSESPNVKGKDRKNVQDLMRARKHVEAMQQFFADVDVIVVEIPHGSQSSRAMASYGIVVGILSGIQRPLIPVTATQVKEVVTKDATKKEMIAAMFEKYPDLPWLKNTKGELLTKNEHLADSLATLLVKDVPKRINALNL